MKTLHVLRDEHLMWCIMTWDTGYRRTKLENERWAGSCWKSSSTHQEQKYQQITSRVKVNSRGQREKSRKKKGGDWVRVRQTVAPSWQTDAEGKQASDPTRKHLEAFPKLHVRYVGNAKALPIFANFPKADVLIFLPQTNEVHLGFQGHQEGTAVGDAQVKPQTCKMQTCEGEEVGTQSWHVCLFVYISLPCHLTYIIQSVCGRLIKRSRVRATVLVSHASCSHSFPSDSSSPSYPFKNTPLTPRELGTQTDFMFLIPQLRQVLGERIDKGKAESEGKITRSFEGGETVGGSMRSSPLVPVWYQRGDWLHKQGFPSLPLFLLALPNLL